MNKTQIHAEIVGHSLSPQGDELISVLCTFPRIIIAEMNTHRMLSKNTSSSRAIPFNKMVEAVKTNPFIPIAWQKHHSGMQGNEYWDITFKGEIGELDHTNIPAKWLRARDTAVTMAEVLHGGPQGVTKQLCNRILEPFMWTTMLITGSKESWNNFFELRCPQYSFDNIKFYKSKKEAALDIWGKEQPDNPEDNIDSLGWFRVNKGQAEIHIMDLAEKIYDAMNESTPKQLQAGEWHIPMADKIPFVGNLIENIDENNTFWKDYDEQNKVKISVSLAARTSYTVVGDEKEINYQKMVELHDRLIAQNPPHSSPMEHCARAMSDEEYCSFIKGNFYQEIEIDADGFIDISTHSNNSNSFGWCRNFKGFIPYRHLIEENQ